MNDESSNTASCEWQTHQSAYVKLTVNIFFFYGSVRAVKAAACSCFTCRRCELLCLVPVMSGSARKLVSSDSVCLNTSCQSVFLRPSNVWYLVSLI